MRGVTPGKKLHQERGSETRASMKKDKSKDPLGAGFAWYKKLRQEVWNGM